MARVRRIPTSITSARHLIRSLEAGGFKRVERYDTPQTLLSWRNQPLAESAEIIVRRDQIGATADDLGFTRRADGGFDALVSEIHLARLDKRWFQQLHERCAGFAAADGDAPAPPAAPATMAATPRREEPGERAMPRAESRAAAESAPVARAQPVDPLHDVRATLQAALQGFVTADDSASSGQPAPGELNLDRELAAVLGAARQSSGKLGCIPLVFGWVLFSLLSIATKSPLLFFIATSVAIALAARKGKQRIERMVGAAAAEFRMRFRDDPQLRARAVRRLRADIVKHTPELKQVVEGLLRRLGE